MKKNIKKNKYFLITAFLCVYLLLPVLSLASSIEIPSSQEDNLGKYIEFLYKAGLAIVGITAMGALIYGGMLYILSGGSQNAKGKAHDYIFGSISGIILLASSFIILNVINPDLTKGEMSLSRIPYSPANPQGGGNEESGENNGDDGGNENGNDNPERPEEPENPLNLSSNMCKAGLRNCSTGSEELNNKLNTAFNACQNDSACSDWVITEGYPPSYPHKSACHNVYGTCVDLRAGDRSTSADSVSSIYRNLTNAGLTAKYECTSGRGCCSNYSGVNCMYNSAASGNHFHVY